MSKYAGMPCAGMEDDSCDEFDSIVKTTQNLKITIVPDITMRAGLNGADFDSTLPHDTVRWLQSLRSTWNSMGTANKKTPAVVQQLKAFYMADENPLLLALKLFANLPGSNNLKTKSLPLFILETVCELKQILPNIASRCTDDMRMVAFNFVKTCSILSLYKAVIDTYELKRIKHLLVDKIKELIGRQCYRDAAYWAIYLGLTEMFDIFEIAIPLILQDRITTVEEYLRVTPSQQRQVVEFLDTLLDKKQSVYEYCDMLIAKYNYTDVKMSKLHFRILSKLVGRLMDQYKVPQEAAPNRNFSKSLSYINYMLHKRYDQGTMSTDAWRELAKETATTKELQFELVLSVQMFNDVKEAAYWAKLFDLPVDQLSEDLQNELKATPPDTVCNSDKIDGLSDQQTSDFYKLTLSADRIVLVNTNDQMRRMIKELEPQTLVGFDSEWKPSAYRDTSISLIQLAIDNKVFLIDATSHEISNDVWKSLGRNVFNNLEILKVGFGLKQDLIMLHRGLPNLNVSLHVTSSYLDLNDLWNKLSYTHGFEFPYKNESYTGRSLNALVELCLGKKLDKSNQFSNWANRPLRKDQIIYAALDAYCLLEIYSVISAQLSDIGLDINKLVEEETSNGSLVSTKSYRKTPKPNEYKVRPQKYQSGPSSLGMQREPIRASKLKFIGDHMLHGLVKEMRKLGIDCQSTSLKDVDSDACVKIALAENRCLLTRDSRYARFSQYLPGDLCFEVLSQRADEQMLNVLKYFDIIVHEEDIFSRCVSCNCNEFILARNSHMVAMRYGREQQRLAYDLHWVQSKPRNFILKEITTEIVRTQRTTKNAAISFKGVQDDILYSVGLFYICDNCGKFFWDGTHLHNFLGGKFKPFIRSSSNCLDVN